MLIPDTSVEMLFEDTEGLVDTLKERPNCLVKYNPQSRASQASSRMVVIGSKLPLAEIKSILVEALTRYKKLQYYSASNDHFLRYFYHEFEIGIGFGNKGAKELGIDPIKSGEMLDALETSHTTDDLLTFIRSRYQGEFETFDIEPITVTSYRSATTGAVDPPAASKGKIFGSEYLATTTRPDFYGLTTRMYVDTFDEFLEQFPEVEPMLHEWISNRGDEARDFAVCVGAEGPLQTAISDYITDAYNKGAVFGNAPTGVTISVVIDNRANDSRLHYELKRN